MIKGSKKPSDMGFTLYLPVVLLSAAILGPLLFWALDGRYPFHRMMDRAFLIAAVAALVLVWHRIELRSWWKGNRTCAIHLACGYVVALVSVQAIAAAFLVGVGLTWAPVITGHVAKIIATAFTAALLVPFVEETLFRGYLQTEFVRRIGWRWGWILSAFIYAWAHFLKCPVEFDHQPVHGWSGFAAVFQSVGDAGIAGGTAVGHLRGFNLLLIGLILGGTFHRLGTLWFNYGLHSGWILGLLLLSGFTRPANPPRLPWLGVDLLGNLLTTLVLLLVGWWLWRYYPPSFAPPEAGARAPSTSPSPGP